ncbi:hypothetical protein GCM10028819_09280 [Spirosoma humi]
METRRRWLIFMVMQMSWLPVSAQTATGRYPHKAKHPAAQVAYVVICESRSSYAYYSSMCRDLAQCTHGVSQVSVAQARNAGYIPCKICC